MLNKKFINNYKTAHKNQRHKLKHKAGYVKTTKVVAKLHTTQDSRSKGGIYHLKKKIFSLEICSYTYVEPKYQIISCFFAKLQ